MGQKKMSTIYFSGTSGKVIAKKRKRVKGANHVKKAEIKYYNPLVTMGDPATRNNYGSVMMSNIFYPNTTGFPNASTRFSSWVPYPLHFPDIGSNYWEMIGDKMKLKWLRFKGYIQMTKLCISAVNWRLVLYRREQPEDLFGDAPTLNAKADAILDAVYDNVEHFVNAEDVTTVARHNYYKKIKDVTKTTVKRKVIASGSMPITNTPQGSNSRTIGATSGINETFSADIIASPLGPKYMPLDITVVCNDWIRKGVCQYYIVLETDHCYGIDIPAARNQSTGVSAVFPSVQVSDGWGQSMFFLNFFVRAYFVDP